MQWANERLNAMTSWLHLDGMTGWSHWLNSVSSWRHAIKSTILMKLEHAITVFLILITLTRMNALFLWSLDHVSSTLIGLNERLVDCYRFRLTSLALIGGMRFLDL